MAVLEDDGLENRKTAYETMYTLLATSFAKIDLPAFTNRVLAALRDVNEIKVLGLMLLLRLAELAPGSVVPHLDEVVESLKAIMKDLEVKEDTIKQDLQRKGESMARSAKSDLPRGDSAFHHAHCHPTVPHDHCGSGASLPLVCGRSPEAGPVEGVPRIPGVEVGLSVIWLVRSGVIFSLSIDEEACCITVNNAESRKENSSLQYFSNMTIWCLGAKKSDSGLGCGSLLS